MKKVNDINLLRMVIKERNTIEGLVSGNYIAYYEMTDENIKVLEAFIWLVMKTGYTKAETKEMLLGNGSYRKCYYAEGAAKNANTSRSRIYYDMSKIRKRFGENIVYRILTAENEELLAITEEINKVSDRERKSILLNGFYIKIPDGLKERKQISEEERKAFELCLKRYSKKVVERVEIQVMSRIAGYIRYLEENEASLDENQNRDLSMAKQYLC